MTEDEGPEQMTVAPTLPSVFSDTHKNIPAHAWTRNAPLRLFPTPGAYAGLDCDAFFDPNVDMWLKDHTPTWTVPALPPMLVLDVVLRTANNFLHEPVYSVQSFDLFKPIVLTSPYALRCDPSFGGRDNDELHIAIHAMPVEHTAQRAQFEKVGSAVLKLDVHEQKRPRQMWPLEGASAVDEMTLIDERTYGPAFPSITSLLRDRQGAQAMITAAHCPMRDEVVQITLLDAALQAIPHDFLSQWAPQLRQDVTGHVRKVFNFQQFEKAILSEPVEVRIEFCGYERNIIRFPMFDVQLVQHDEVLSAFCVVDEISTMAPLAELSPGGRRAFLRDRLYVGGAGVSQTDDHITQLVLNDVHAMDWLGGTIAAAYALESDDQFVEIAVRDHIARQTKQHPALVELADDLRSGHTLNGHTEMIFVDVKRDDDRITVTDSKKRTTPSATRRHRAHHPNSRHA